MPEDIYCAECSAPLPAYWPKGLCARCALDGVLDLPEADTRIRSSVEPPSSSENRPSRAGPPPNVPGGCFGDYELLEEIARGGMGVVYRARQVSLNRTVALKMILSGQFASKQEVLRFRAEAEAAANLRHPNIVAIHETGEEEGRHYFSMDYVRGRNLAEIAVEGPLPAKRAARYARIVAEAIHYAHEQGVLHRDLKPSNILIDENDQPRITDFGLAKRARGDFGLTVTGQLLGSPNFMPPEQTSGKSGKVGPASDVYGLGAIVYHLLTGRPPFQAETIEDVLRQLHEADPVAPHLLNPSIPRDLETICLKCLEKDPAKRYPSAQELANELGRFVRDEPIRAHPINAPEKIWRWCRRKPVLASLIALIFVVSAAGLAGILAQWQRAEWNATAQRHERERAEKGETEARRLLYVANMNLAQQAWEQANIVRLRQLLEETKESPDRGFEWYYWQRQTHLALKTLRGHLESVNSVAFSSDGQRIVTGSGDQTAKVWDAVSGTNLLTLKGHIAQITSVAFSPDGQRIVTGSRDQTAKVWEAASGRELLTLKGHSNQILSVAFSPDGQKIVTCSRDQTAKVWEAASGRELLTLKGHNDLIWSVAFSPNGQRIVTGGSDQTAKVWEAVRGTNLLTLTGHSNQILSVAFSPNGLRIVTGSADQTAKVWDAASGREMLTLKGHSAWIWSVAFSPNGQRIVTGSADQTAKVWEAASGRELLTPKGHSAWIWSVAFSRDGQRIVTGSEDQTAKVWETTSGREMLSLKGHSAGIRSVASSPDGQRIVTGSLDQTAKVWDAVRGTNLFTLTGHRAPIWSVAFSPDGQRIVTGSDDQTAKVWDAVSGTNLLTLRGHSAGIRSVAFSPDGQRIVTGSLDQTAKVWEAVRGTNLLTLKGHSAPIWSVAFSPDGQRIVTGSDDQTAKVWDAVSGTNLLTLTGHSAGIWSVAFSPDGQRIVTGSEDKAAKVWEAASGRELLTLARHTAPIRSVAFSPDGQWIVTGSEDQTARVWQAAPAEQVAAWHEEERAAAQYLAALQRERTTEQEAQRIARARDEGAIKRWLILAPIASATNQNGAEGLDTEQVESEGRLRPKAGEGTVIGSGEMKWQEVTQEDYVIDFNVILGHRTTRSVAYAVCYIRLEAEQRGLQMLVGSNAEAKVYLNGKQVHKYPFGRGFVADQDMVPDIALNAGLNVLVFKVVSEIPSWKGSIRFTDAQGKPVSGIRVTLDPDAKDSP